MGNVWKQLTRHASFRRFRPEPEQPHGAPQPASPGNGDRDARRYLAIVARDRPDLVSRVSRLFLMDEKVDVILDRREGERRQHIRAHVAERRAAERRRAPRPEADLALHPVVIASRHHDLPADLPAGSSQAGALEGEARMRMRKMAAMDTRQRVVQWVEESRDLVSLLPGLLDHLTTVEQECERLRQELSALQREKETLLTERAEVSEALNRVMLAMTQPINEIAQRLRAA